ncbi:uncharacterized protein [Parasteatoda tepidariorum]|uniref:uncharacterized protein n=1 Tax=Parasteatoda tepidariorum TaxID=114398 RepID=UPI0039BC5879
MYGFFHSAVLILFFKCVICFSLRKDQSIINQNAFGASYDDCDPSSIPVMHSFDMKKFSGKWFELAKTVTGYIDVADGVWLIEGNNASHNFLFSGRDNNQHCIRPIKGKLSTAQEPPGMLTLRYTTYSTHVEENVRVLFTDYSSVDFILFLSPCKVEQWDTRIDDFPAPDYCYQMLDLGSCNANLQRFYYDAREKTCKQFTFGGCNGNNNNFMSNSECQKKCAIASNKDPVCMTTAKCGLFCSPCCTEDANGCVHCNCELIVESEDNPLNCVSSPSKCPEECDLENIYQGCHVCRCGEVNRNDDFGICNEVKDPGTCNDGIERYYFDAVYQKCEQFTYRGCGGNNNNFQTLQECREKCLKPERDHTVVMKSPVDENDPNSSHRSSTSVLLTTLLILLVNIYCLDFIHH